MPSSAAQNGCADLVLPPDEIARRLAQIRSHFYLERAAPLDIAEENAAHLYQRTLARVRAVTGVDFTQYRDTTIKRRVLRRMALYTQQSLAQYVERLENDPKEVTALYHDLLINVTSFFRDPALFDALTQTVYPEIVKGKEPMAPVRVWAPGCSTGQEAYSIAMSLIEFFDNKPIRPPIQIFATNISDPAILDKARAGIYPESIEAEVSPQRLRRFFHKESHFYRIEKSIRDLCIFARQNLIADPPFSHVDLVTCRNVLIYLSAPLQRRVLPMFHYTLNVPGFLVLGSSETIGDEYEDLFEPVERASRIYRKKPNESRPRIQQNAEAYRGRPESSGRAFGTVFPSGDFQREADRVLLGRFAPPGVLINENLDIIQFRGRTSAYLEPPPGEPTTKLLKMAREGLFLELRSAIGEAGRSEEPVRRERLRVRSDGDLRLVNIEVIPIKPVGRRETCFLILFEEQGTPELATGEVSPALARQPEEQEIVQLRKELSATKEYLESLIEQQDAANEELRSANEEILSGNEELQSTNEELETAKEELQSANEELTTVNDQLQTRNQELKQANDDLTNLLTSTAMPVVMVGLDLRIRRFTQAARQAMNLLVNDIGRPIGDLRTNIEIPDLEEMILDVIERDQIREREVRDRSGRWHTLRIHPYTSEQKVEGAVLMLIDIDEIKSSAEALRRSEEELRLAVEAGSLGTWYWDLKSQRSYWDKRTHAILGLPDESAREGEQFFAAFHPEDRDKLRSAQRRAADDNGGFAEELRFTRPDGSIGWLWTRAKVLVDETGTPARLAGVCLDITAQKQAETSLMQRVEELKQADRQKNEFLAVLSHELRNPLAPIGNAVEILRGLDSSDPKLSSSRDIIGREVAHLSRMLEDLLDVSRLNRERLVLRKELMSLAVAVREAVETSQTYLNAKKHQLTINLPPDNLWVEADRVRLCQALSNLLINAAKYTPEPGQISIAVEPLSGNRVAIHIRDNGIGISQELLGRIFEMFTQGEPGSAEGGLGIGLTLVKSLIALHGGNIEATSEGVGRGSEFIVRLPLAAAPAHPAVTTPYAAPTTQPSPPPQAHPRRGRHRIASLHAWHAARKLRPRGRDSARWPVSARGIGSFRSRFCPDRSGSARGHERLRSRAPYARRSAF